MLSHERIWGAIDALAERYKLSPSGLARRGGLDPTTFNKSKRQTGDGRFRWPSTESIAKVLNATGASLGEFLCLVEGEDPGRYIPGGIVPNRTVPLPMIGFGQAAAGGFLDEAGLPVGHDWDIVDFPTAPANRPGVYALEVQGDSMLPLYRDGDVLVIEPGAQMRRGDRVIVKTVEGEMMVKVLFRQTSKSIELVALDTEQPNRTFDLKEVQWTGRIIWASQ